jgi:hypothetical protein
MACLLGVVKVPHSDDVIVNGAKAFLQRHAYEKARKDPTPVLCEAKVVSTLESDSFPNHTY